MPFSAADLVSDGFLRVLLLGDPKIGKTRSSIVSLAESVGHGYVIACGDKNSLEPAARHTRQFSYDIVRDENDMEEVIKITRDGVKDKKYKWVVVDDYTIFASKLENRLRKQSVSAQNERKAGDHEADMRRVSPEYRLRLCNIIGRLFDINCHFVFTAHYIDLGKELDGQLEKTGEGIYPMVMGAARKELPTYFKDIIFMDKEIRKGEQARRVFRINPQGVYGPVGGRSIDGEMTIDADFGEFIRLCKEEGKKSNGSSRDARRGVR